VTDLPAEEHDVLSDVEVECFVETEEARVRIDLEGIG
jgi:hypothetical protein